MGWLGTKAGQRCPRFHRADITDRARDAITILGARRVGGIHIVDRVGTTDLVITLINGRAARFGGLHQEPNQWPASGFGQVEFGPGARHGIATGRVRILQVVAVVGDGFGAGAGATAARCPLLDNCIGQGQQLVVVERPATVGAIAGKGYIAQFHGRVGTNREGGIDIGNRPPFAFRRKIAKEGTVG